MRMSCIVSGWHFLHQHDIFGVSSFLVFHCPIAVACHSPLSGYSRRVSPADAPQLLQEATPHRWVLPSSNDKPLDSPQKGQGLIFVIRGSES